MVATAFARPLAESFSDPALRQVHEDYRHEDAPTGWPIYSPAYSRLCRDTHRVLHDPSALEDWYCEERGQFCAECGEECLADLKVSIDPHGVGCYWHSERELKGSHCHGAAVISATGRPLQACEVET